MPKKKKLTKSNQKIKRLVQKHGFVRLETYRKSDNGPYAMRHLHKNGNCFVRYWSPFTSFRGRKKQSSCFIEDYAMYYNNAGDKIVRMDITGTLLAMQEHDRGYVKVKYIHAGDWIYEV